MVGASVYKQPFRSHSNVLVEPVEAHYESAEWAVSFEKDATKEQFLGEVSNNGVLKTLFRQALLDTFSARERKAQDILFQFLDYGKLLSRFCMASDMDHRENKSKVVQARKKLQRRA